MAFQDFPEDLYIITVQNEDEKLGTYDFTAITELKHAQLGIYKHGNFTVTNQRFRLKVYSTVAEDNLLFTSDWVNLNEVEDIDGAYWLGYVRFDFSRPPISPNMSYSVVLETSNYTYVDDTEYFGIVLDTDHAIYLPQTEGAALIKFFGHEAT